MATLERFSQIRIYGETVLAVSFLTQMLLALFHLNAVFTVPLDAWYWMNLATTFSGILVINLLRAIIIGSMKQAKKQAPTEPAGMVLLRIRESSTMRRLVGPCVLSFVATLFVMFLSNYTTESSKRALDEGFTTRLSATFVEDRYKDFLRMEIITGAVYLWMLVETNYTTKISLFSLQEP
jgi:hypothetical protein